MKHYIVRLRDPHSGILLQELSLSAPDERDARDQAYLRFWVPRWGPRFYEVEEVKDNENDSAANN